MRGLALAALVLLALCGAGVAHAGTVTLSGDTLSFAADPGETNRVFVVHDPAGMHVIDTGAAVTAGAGCSQEAAGEAFCAADDTTILTIDVAADDQDDHVDLSPAGTFLASRIDGGPGDDTLTGGNAFSGNVFDGGPGGDTFSGNGAVDYSARTNPVTVTIGDGLANDGEAGEGDLVPNEIDQVWGGEGADTITAMNAANVGATYLKGGGGNDHLSALREGWTAIVEGDTGDDVLKCVGFDSTVFGGDGEDLLTGAHDGQALEGGKGNDILRGNAGRDRLIGGAGADELNGGPGKDSISGGHGPDTILARDHKRDAVDGGPGKDDRARVDVGLDRVLNVEELF